eukprot:101724_1
MISNTYVVSYYLFGSILTCGLVDLTSAFVILPQKKSNSNASFSNGNSIYHRTLGTSPLTTTNQTNNPILQLRVKQQNEETDLHKKKKNIDTMDDKYMDDTETQEEYDLVHDSGVYDHSLHHHYLTEGGMYDISEGPEHHLINVNHEQLENLSHKSENVFEVKKLDVLTVTIAVFVWLALFFFAFELVTLV